MHEEIQSYTEKYLVIKIINFYLFSNIHVAFVAFFLVKMTLENIGISKNTTAWFVFFATLLSYNIIRFLRLSDINNWYNLWIKHHLKLLYTLSISSFIAVVYLSFHLRFKAILVLLPFSLATFFYVFPLKKYSLRNVAGLKLFLIAFSWAGITVLFPLAQNYLLIRTADWLVFLQRFMFLIAITVPFDIRDVNYDVSELKTLPQQLGIYKSKILAISLLVVFVLLEFLKPKIEIHLLPTVLIAIISGILVWFSTPKQSKYYSAFLVESLPIIWYALYHLNILQF